MHGPDFPEFRRRIICRSSQIFSHPIPILTTSLTGSYLIFKSISDGATNLLSRNSPRFLFIFAPRLQSAHAHGKIQSRQSDRPVPYSSSASSSALICATETRFLDRCSSVVIMIFTLPCSVLSLCETRVSPERQQNDPRYDSAKRKRPCTAPSILTHDY